MSKDLESLSSNGNAFQSFGAAQVNDLSPSVGLDINAGCLSKRVSLERLRLQYGGGFRDNSDSK